MPQLLPVRGVRWVEDGAPPWVEVEFVDADGVRQVLQGKSIEFTAGWDSEPEIPSHLTVPCEVVGPVQADGSVSVTMDLPWLEDGRTFRVLADLLR